VVLKNIADSNKITSEFSIPEMAHPNVLQLMSVKKKTPLNKKEFLLLYQFDIVLCMNKTEIASMEIEATAKISK
jgi:hypothetical protein